MGLSWAGEKRWWDDGISRYNTPTEGDFLLHPADMSRNFWSGVIFGPGRTKITAFLVRLCKKLSDRVSFSWSHV